MERRTFLAAVGAASAGLSGCTGVLGTSGSGPEFDVGMRANAFVPTAYETPVGETVVWHNNNDRAHTVTAYGDTLPEGAGYFASGGFESESAAREGYNELEGAIYAGESYEHTFSVPGTYGYFCVPHERGGMSGQIVVRE